MKTGKKKWLIYLLLVLGAIVMIIPFGWMVIVAFTKPDITYQMTIENILNSLSLNSFKTLFTEYSMVRYALNSIIVSVISTAGQILLCAMSGFVLQGSISSIRKRYLSLPCDHDDPGTGNGDPSVYSDQ